MNVEDCCEQVKADLRRDLARMTRRHRDCLCQLRKVRADLKRALFGRDLANEFWKQSEEGKETLLANACTRRCPFRRGK